MSDPWQCVVLRIEIDQSSAGSTPDFERGFQAISMASNRKALFLEKIADNLMGSVFLICELRMGPNLARRFSLGNSEGTRSNLIMRNLPRGLSDAKSPAVSRRKHQQRPVRRPNQFL